MKNKKSAPTIFDNRTAIGFESFIDKIVDVYAEFGSKKVKWSNRSDLEIGFYIKDKKTKTSIFFGTWYSSWSHFGMPLCIAISYDGVMKYEKYLKLVKSVKNKFPSKVLVKEFENHSILLFEETFFNHVDDVNVFVELLNELISFYNIHIK